MESAVAKEKKKLTLSLKSTIIEDAKAYAREQNTSLSLLVEAFFEKLTAHKNPEQNAAPQLSPQLRELSGVISVPDDFDYKDEIAAYLSEKYK